jgi:hypothetical protein
MRHPTQLLRSLVLIWTSALLLTSQVAPVLAAQSAEPPIPADSLVVPASAQTTEEATLTAVKGSAINVEPALLQLEAAALTGSTEALAAHAGDPNVNLAAGTVRVILEMAVNPDARSVGSAHTKTVALANGQLAYVETAPSIAIRRDLADAIAAQGAQYETAYEDRVQVLAPVASITELAQLPGVRLVRFPYPATLTDAPAPSGLTSPAPQVGSRTSEGVSLTKATAWHTAGYTGAGTNIAVFDFGFSGWKAMQASGDLPGGARLIAKDFNAAV